MNCFGIPTKLVKLVSATMEGAKACVKIQNDLADHSEVKRGLKQGDGLALILFNIFLEYAIRQLSVDVNSSLIYKSGQIVGYADYINIMERSMQTVEKIYRELEEHTKIIGFTINTMKTKVMIQSRRDVSCQQTHLLGIEAVDSFTYLGTGLTKGNEEEVEIKKRIMSANKVYFSLFPIIKSRLAHRKDKLRLYKTLIRPLLSYGCEAWTMTQSSGERLAII
jgi:hypothetical protein